jgi:hypothetical protein
LRLAACGLRLAACGLQIMLEGKFISSSSFTLFLHKETAPEYAVEDGDKSYTIGWKSCKKNFLFC